MSEKSCTFAPKINMTTLIDISKFAVIDEIALQKTRYLRKYYTFSQRNGGKEEISFTYLRRLLPEHTEELPDSIARVFSDLGRVHLPGQNDLQTIGSTQVHISQFIWARLCVAAYYFFHDEPLWQDLVFRKLKERILLPDLVADVQTAKNLIDGYYKELALLSGAAPTPQVKPAPVATLELQRQASSTPKHKPEDVFAFAYQRTADYARLLQFLDAEKQDCTDLEWERYALAIFRCKKVFQKRPPTFTQWLPIFCDMFGRKVEYREPNKLDRGKNEKDITVFLSM